MSQPSYVISANVNCTLEAKNLQVVCETGGGKLPLLEDVNFDIRRGEVFVLLGESGSGKTILSRSLTKLFSHGTNLQVSGTVLVDARDVLSADRQELQDIRRNKVRYVFQEPALALNPVATIRSQMKLAAPTGLTAESELLRALDAVGLRHGGEILDSYPHQLSGGMAQRVMIAMAILPGPSLLIADEPTSAVDASLRFHLLDLLTSIRSATDMALLLITHDLDVARRYADRIAVLYRGRLIEIAGRDEFFTNPLHPYSQLLIESMPATGKSLDIDTNPLVVERPTPNSHVAGCRFYSRCFKAQSNCHDGEPLLEQTDDERKVRCFYWK